MSTASKLLHNARKSPRPTFVCPPPFKMRGKQQSKLVRCGCHTLWLLSLLAASLLGCTEKVYLTPEVSNHAAALRASADPAVTHFLQLAAQSASPAREYYWLEAADKFIVLHQSTQARSLMDQIDRENLPESMQYLYLLVEAKLALAEHNPQQTLLALAELQQADLLSEDSKVDLLNSRAQALEQLGQLLPAAETRLKLAELLHDEDEITLNHQKIWRLLNATPEAELIRASTSPDHVKNGWITLSLIAKQQGGQGNSFNAKLNQWLQNYPNHPAKTLLAKNAYSENVAETTATSISAFPQRIAVLLPLSGSLAQTANAVRDGLLTAFYEEQSNGKTDARRIKFYDTDNDENVLARYNEAIADGSEMVIGPLTKEGVAKLEHLSRLAVPVLALNQLEGQTPFALPKHNNLFQFSLAPEDEIRQVSLHAWSRHHLNALILAEDSDRGRRMAYFFQKQWHYLGGQVVDTKLFPNPGDPSSSLQSVLHIEASKARAANIKNIIRRNFDFQPRRRDDFDVIFLAATPTQARRVKPLLAFYFAGNVPVYATSNVYTGKLDALLDKDLDGTTFCDAPWVINPAFANSNLAKNISALWDSSKNYTRLYGLGVDAYQLLHYLPRLQQYPQLVYRGASGDLSLANNLQFRRELPCAKFQGNKLQLLKDMPIAHIEGMPPKEYIA